MKRVYSTPKVIPFPSGNVSPEVDTAIELGETLDLDMPLCDAFAPLSAIREAHIFLDDAGIARRGEMGPLELLERIALLAEQRDTLMNAAREISLAFAPLRIEVDV